MKRVALTGLLIALGACSAPPPPPAAPVEAPAETAPETTAAEDRGLNMKGIRLFLYDSATPGVERTPVFMVEADAFGRGDSGAWTFEGARATAYDRNTGEEEISFEAATGMLKEDELAYLSGGVIARTGTMTMTLEDLEWRQATETTPGRASSDHPLRIEDPKLRLDAATVVLNPDEQTLILTEMKGEFDFGSESQ